MRQAVRNILSLVFCLLLAVPVLAQDKKAGGPTGPAPSAAKEAFMDLVTTWWLWVGIIAILALLGVLYYVRNKQDED